MIAGLEEHLSPTAFSINPDGFFLSNGIIRTDDSKPVLPVALVADIDDFSRNCFFAFTRRF